MKKILNIFAIFSLVTSGTSIVIGCSHYHNPPATKQQEEDSLINFAQQNGIQENEINKSNWSFQDRPAIDEKEVVNFTFEELKNVKNTQLLKKFNGQMVYNLENKTFSLNGEPFNNPILIPGYYQTSTTFPSTITGNANDFTIAAGYNDLRNLSDDLERPDTQTLQELFTAMHWKNVANFEDKYGKPLLTVPDLESLQKTTWRLPNKGYMALINAVKTSGTYHIAWTNLDSDQDRHSLLEPDGHGDISSVFWKDIKGNVIEYHLWCNQELVKEIVQIYELYLKSPKKNPWFQNNNLNKWLIDKSGDPQTQEPGLGVQTININSYLKYHTSIYMLDKVLQNLNNADFANWVQKHNCKNYDLIFNKNFSFNAEDSKDLN